MVVAEVAATVVEAVDTEEVMVVVVAVADKVSIKHSHGRHLHTNIS